MPARDSSIEASSPQTQTSPAPTTTPPQPTSQPNTPPSSAPSRGATPSPPPPTRAHQTLIRNRRLHYLSTNPTYFTATDLELADPLLYDRLIRQYLTPAEREAQGRARGWSGVLEADLTRAEAKVAALAANGNTNIEARVETTSGEVVSSREEGEALWRETMTLRFLGGGDEDADYKAIDESEEWDDHETERREVEEKWFDAETPSEVTGDTGVQDY